MKKYTIKDVGKIFNGKIKDNILYTPMRIYKDKQDYFYVVSDRSGVTKLGRIVYGQNRKMSDTVPFLSIKFEFFPAQHETLVELLGLEIDQKSEMHKKDGEFGIYILNNEENYNKLLHFYAIAKEKERYEADIKVVQFDDDDHADTKTTYQPHAVNSSWEGACHATMEGAIWEMIKNGYFYKWALDNIENDPLAY